MAHAGAVDGIGDRRLGDLDGMQLEPLHQAHDSVPAAAGKPALSWVQRNRMIGDLVACDFHWHPDDLMRTVVSIAIGKTLYTDDFLLQLWKDVPAQYKTADLEGL